MKTITFVLVLLAASAALAQTPGDLSGHWKGTIEIPGNAIEFEVDLARNARGDLFGTATAGVDKVTLPLQTVALDGNELTFFARTDQPFKGEVSSRGRSVSGTATLSGYSLPFTMDRTGDATIEPRPTSPAVGKDLEGVWTGVLSGPSRQLHFVLTIANQPDGNALAHEVSVDEGRLMLYVVVKQNGRRVTIDSRGVPTSFAGDLNAGNTEISGTWTQGETRLPLTLTRATVEGQR